MPIKKWSLKNDLTSIRHEFPILQRCIYLISNSLGAVPSQVQDDLLRFYKLWAKEGVSSWEIEWWNLSSVLGNNLASFLGAGKDEITMITNATQGHWIALSNKFLNSNKRRKKIIMTDHDFPSSLYAVSQIANFMNWEIDLIKSHGKSGIPSKKIIERIDERVLFVATSHIYFKTAYVQDIEKIAECAREAGALTLIDGYHAPGTYPVNLRQLDVDFYIGGCLKWLCGGPGNAFLYANPKRLSNLQPQLTGWLAHERPFSFDKEMKYIQGSYKFMSGTPPIPSLYTAQAGLDIIRKVGISQIRRKSVSQTKKIIKLAKERNYSVFSPEQDEKRGGAVSVAFPHAFQLKQALNEKGIKVDFRKHQSNEPDVIRIGPHFYTTDKEIELLFQEVDKIYATEEFKKYSPNIHVIS